MSMKFSLPTRTAFARNPFERVSLARQFLLVGAVVLALSGATIGAWIDHQIEAREVNHAAEGAALYVESILAAPLKELVEQGSLSPGTSGLLDSIFVAGPLARKVVRFKLWTADGRIQYSSHPEQTNLQFPLHDHQAYAFSGQLHASITELDGPDNAAERARWHRLIEIYVPLRLRGNDTVSAVAEFYESMEDVEVDIRADQRQSWLAIVFATLLLFLGLYALVHRASQTITGQQSDLNTQLADLRGLLADNRAMNARLQQAGALTTSMTELSLRRIAADLHDGPTQDLALALLTVDERWGEATHAPKPAEVTRLRECLQRAMVMLRNIAGGLVVPGMAQLSLADVVRRAVSDASRKAGCSIGIEVDDGLGEAPEAVKITAYRVVQEALTNCLRHAPGHCPCVAARLEGGHVVLQVTDQGPGFDTRNPPESGHLGLAFLRERVQLLAGTIEVQSSPGHGTVIRARLPLLPQVLADA